MVGTEGQKILGFTVLFFLFYEATILKSCFKKYHQLKSIEK